MKTARCCAVALLVALACSCCDATDAIKSDKTFLRDGALTHGRRGTTLSRVPQEMPLSVSRITQRVHRRQSSAFHPISVDALTVFPGRLLLRAGRSRGAWRGREEGSTSYPSSRSTPDRGSHLAQLVTSTFGDDDARVRLQVLPAEGAESMTEEGSHVILTNRIVLTSQRCQWRHRLPRRNASAQMKNTACWEMPKAGC